jgi:hypothetical protein
MARQCSAATYASAPAALQQAIESDLHSGGLDSETIIGP